MTNLNNVSSPSDAQQIRVRARYASNLTNARDRARSAAVRRSAQAASATTPLLPGAAFGSDHPADVPDGATDDDGVFRVDRIHLTEIELRIKRDDRNTWRWQVLYVGAVQVEGITHEGEADAFARAQRHRDLWLEQEMEALRRFAEPAD
jgi:hypothetical protein